MRPARNGSKARRDEERSGVQCRSAAFGCVCM